jgi:hypothetical protein
MLTIRPSLNVGGDRIESLNEGGSDQCCFETIANVASWTNWPPAWLWVGGIENTRACGEIGILREGLPSNVQPANRCFLPIDYEGSSYMGCLLFDDHVICRSNREAAAGLLGSSQLLRLEV